MLAAQDDVHTVDFGNLFALELGVTTRNHHQGVRVLADEVADVLSALAVGQRRHAARVDDAHVGHFAWRSRQNAVLGEQ